MVSSVAYVDSSTWYASSPQVHMHFSVYSTSYTKFYLTRLRHAPIPYHGPGLYTKIWLGCHVSPLRGPIFNATGRSVGGLSLYATPRDITSFESTAQKAKAMEI